MLVRILVVSLVVLLTACTSATRNGDGIFRDRKYDYRKAQSDQRMQIPAGFDSQTIVDYYPVPEASPYADTELIYNPPLPRGLLVDVEHKVRLQRLGAREWILLQLTPSETWPRLKAFLQQNQLPVVQENGEQGLLLISTAQGFFRLQLQQGFQRSHAELAVRFSPDASIAQHWPLVSPYAQQESDMLMSLAQFLARSESPVYSYVAHKISVEQRLLFEYDEQGVRYLLLKADEERVRASLHAAMNKGDFTELEGSDVTQLLVQYTPQSDKIKKRSFWQRVFRIKPKPFDASMPYAGNKYRFIWQSVGDYQKVQLQLFDSDKKRTPEQQQKEINQQLLAIKGLLT